MILSSRHGSPPGKLDAPILPPDVARYDIYARRDLFKLARPFVAGRIQLEEFCASASTRVAEFLRKCPHALSTHPMPRRLRAISAADSVGASPTGVQCAPAGYSPARARSGGAPAAAR